MATLTFTLPDNRLAAFATGFLKEKPIPLDENGVPLYTPIQWIRLVMLNVANDIRYRGDLKIFEETGRPPRVNDVT